MRVLLATHHPQIDSLIEKLESQKGIRELEDSLMVKGLCQWAKPIFIVDQALYRERVIEKAKAAQPDVIVLYDKLPGTIGLEVLLEEMRIEVKNTNGNDTRVILLTSLEKGEPLLRKAVEIGIWDIISGQDISPISIIESLYRPANYSDSAGYRCSSDDNSMVRIIPKYVERVVQLPEVREEKVTRIVKEKEYIKVGNRTGVKEVILLWSPFEAGKTFLSVNLSSAFSKMGLKTVLIDGDPHNSAISSHFQITNEEEHVLLKALKERGSREDILGMCHVHRKNLYVFPWPQNYWDSHNISFEEMVHFYDNLARSCEIFVVDGSRETDSRIMQAWFHIATIIVVVITPDLLRASRTQVFLEKLALEGVCLDKCCFILNMSVEAKEAGRKDIALILKRDLLKNEIPAVLEHSYESIAKGIPAYELRNVPHRFVDAINRLALHTLGEASVKRPFLSSLWK